MPVVRIDTKEITDWPSFHDVFARVFGFPDYYGRNMNAWIDCMSWLDEPSSGLNVSVSNGDVVVLHLEDVDAFAERCPEQYRDIVECCAFVNWRRIEAGEPVLLALSYLKAANG